MIRYDKWFDKYKPIKNHLDDNASFDGCMFETYDAELAFVIEREKSHPGTVWTIVDSGNNVEYVEFGIHLVNRLGYLITEVPFTGEFLSVPIH